LGGADANVFDGEGRSPVDMAFE
jgi:hypothetical protein